nr:uncharacterized protein LOC111503298 [Leptinotarsa decemlineata]
MNKKQKTFFEEKNEPDQAGAVFITETSQIQRHSTPGPTASRSASQSTSRIRKNEELMPLSVAKSASIDSETEKQVILTLKKVQKDMTTIEGKVNIISQIEGPREVLCCKYNEEYDYLAAGYADGIIRVYQSATGEHIFTLTDADVKDVRAPCTSIKHRPVSKIYPITNCFTGTCKYFVTTVYHMNHFIQNEVKVSISKNVYLNKFIFKLFNIPTAIFFCIFL